MSKAVTDRMVKSFLDLFLLDLLNHSPKHGYEIMRELKNRTGTTIGAGTRYPLLYELDERKLVDGEWNSPNRRSRKSTRLPSSRGQIPAARVQWHKRSDTFTPTRL